jgi:hypothetical protein
MFLTIGFMVSTLVFVDVERWNHASLSVDVLELLEP